ncbi:MAG: preprotein translocase subunit SecE [Elusimicrobiota bacterium]
MEKITQFIKDSWSELRQVSWLPVPQMVGSTLLVIIMVILMSVYIFFIDHLLKFIFSFIL